VQAQVPPTLDWQVRDAGQGTYSLEDPSVAFSGNGYAHAPGPTRGFTSYYLDLPNGVSVDGDSMLLQTRVKNPVSEGGIPAYDMYIAASGRTSGLGAGFGMFQSAGYGSVYAGITSVSLPNAPMVQDLQYWHTLGFQTQGGLMDVIYDGISIYSLAYQSLIGEIGSLSITFKGTGTIDWVNVSSHENMVLQSSMDSSAVSISSAPEPGTYTMLLTGLGLMAALGRRKRMKI
jgi:hypothetical protein